MIRGSGSGKISALLKMKKEKDSDILTAIDKIFLYAKNLSEPKYQLLIKKRKDTEIKTFNDSKAFVEYSNTMNDFNNNTDNYNPKRYHKILTFFDNMIVDINTYKRILIHSRRTIY